MSTEAPAAQKKINLRRPDIMEAVQAQVLSHYRSELVERIRASGGVLSAGDLTVKLAKEFGFCYGVERAIDLAYAARKYFSDVSPHTPIYLLGEIIHNPEVNDQIRNMGIQIISPKPTDEELSRLQSGDAVIIPAFGTEVGTRKKLEAKGCVLVDTTCGDVMSVWKRVRQYSKENVTSIIHGKAKHEETKATTSQARAYGSGHYLVVFNLDGDGLRLQLHPATAATSTSFWKNSKAPIPPASIPTCICRPSAWRTRPPCCAAKPRRSSAASKPPWRKNTARQNIDKHFRFFDTICGATQDRQDALEKLLREPMDLLIVIGGYNSSNTSHLAEMGEAKLPTYFIKNAAQDGFGQVHPPLQPALKKEVETRDWLPSGKITVGITAGASCPNNLIEDTIRRLFELRGISVQELLAN